MKPFLRAQLERYLQRLNELDFLLSREDIMRDMTQFMALSREHADVAVIAERYNQWLNRQKVLEAAQSMLNDDSNDPDIRNMAQDEIAQAQQEIVQVEEQLQRLLIPKDPDDARPAFLEIRAGTGGDESALFAGDLLRMYTRYAEKRGWRTELVSESPSEIGGYKEVVLRIDGDEVYGWLRFESGGHRVQRIPTTESQGRIHTSACTVAVMPEPDEAIAVQINPSDLRIDTYRASGAGGQHINKTDSAVRLTHVPTGIVVQCQDSRSQHTNRDVAWRRLRSRLYDYEMRKRMDAQQKLEDTKTDVGWGHQIRSYLLDQSRIKDLRTNVEISNTQKVLDGDLDSFIEASLKHGV